jgi:hypothetical protein
MANFKVARSYSTFVSRRLYVYVVRQGMQAAFTWGGNRLSALGAVVLVSMLTVSTWTKRVGIEGCHALSHLPLRCSAEGFSGALSPHFEMKCCRIFAGAHYKELASLSP